MASRDTDQTSTDQVPSGATDRPSASSDGGGEQKRSTRRGGRRRRRRRRVEGGGEPSSAPTGEQEAEGKESGGGQRKSEGRSRGEGASSARPKRAVVGRRERMAREGGGRRERRTKRRRRGGGEAEEKADLGKGSGILMIEPGKYGTLRDVENMLLPNKKDVYVPQRLIQKHRLRDGSLVEGNLGRGQKYKFQLVDVVSVDGRTPEEAEGLPGFRDLISIDPDFHYATGDITDNTSMRVVDVVAPIGRGQRALIVAPPRSGKTTLLREFAAGIEKGYTDVHLMVLLVAERPEEATDWVRSTGGQIFVSTIDETPKNHVQLSEAVWKRAQRFVELGEDVVLIIDSLTRLARAYNNHQGTSGKTMSGGLDSRAMERPRQIFGSARNTETAGSLTIVGTTLVDTGSRMDQMIFEEFKGTGNMELVLNRKLADRRIFPAIDIEKSGTRKEEKLFTKQRLRRITTLRRVLLKMNFIEGMELLITKLDDVEKTDDFLQRFEVDPEA